MRTVRLTKETRNNLLEDLLKRSPNSYGEYEGRVAEIVEAVKEKGDAALFEYTQRFDGARIDASNVMVTEEEIAEAYEKTDPDRKSVV